MWRKAVCLLHTLILVTTTPVPLMHQTQDFHHDSASIRISQVGSDLGLYNREFFEGDIFKRKLRMRNAVSDKNELWPHGTVVYKLDETLGCPDSVQCGILMKAFHHYHTHTCIHFKEWTGEGSYIRIFLNSDTGACWSTVGRQGGEQLVSLGQRCWYKGIVIHELGHSLGFFHEMNRPDRDEYIDIQWENILPGFSEAFSKYTKETVDTLSEKFDYESVMMYDEYAFAKNKRSPTISTKDKTIIGPLWLKRGLSAGDIRRLNKLYKCSGKSSQIDFPYDMSCTFDTHTCGFKNAGTDTWKWNRINQTDGFIYTSSDNSALGPDSNYTEESKTGYFMSINYHAVNSLHSTTMGCVSFWYMMRGQGDMYLKVRQSYLSSTTQLAFIEEDTFDLWENYEPTESWTLVHVPLYVTTPFKLIFESSTSIGNYSLIAFDDFHLQYSPCSEKGSAKSSDLNDDTTSATLPFKLLPTVGR